MGPTVSSRAVIDHLPLEASSEHREGDRDGGLGQLRSDAGVCAEPERRQPLADQLRFREAIRIEPFRVVEDRRITMTFSNQDPDPPALRDQEVVEDDVLLRSPVDVLALLEPQRLSENPRR